MPLPNSLHHLQAKPFARNAQELSGEALLQDFPRLLEETADDAPLRAQTRVRWRLAGQLRETPGGAPQVWLLAETSAHLHLACQRCLGPVEVPVQTHQWFRLVETAEQADLEDADAQEDVLSFAEADDAHALLEDDLLMALPAFVAHEVCPAQLPRQAQDARFSKAQQQARKNPFAALAALRVPARDDEPSD